MIVILGLFILATITVLIVEVVLVTNKQYLPNDPGYKIDFVAKGKTEQKLTLLVLGDSLVAGLGATNQKESLPGQIGLKLAEQLDKNIHVIGIGVSGAQTDDLIKEQVPQVKNYNPDIIVIEIGSNDATHFSHPFGIEKRTRKMIQAAKEKAPDAIILLASSGKLNTPNFLQPLRFVMQQSATNTRQGQKRAAKNEKVLFVDVATEISPIYDTTKGAGSSDTFHPSAIGYEIWARPIAKKISKQYLQIN